MILPEQTIDDLEKLGYEFRLSFYKNDIIKYEKMGNYLPRDFYQGLCRLKEIILKLNL